MPWQHESTAPHTTSVSLMAPFSRGGLRECCPKETVWKQKTPCEWCCHLVHIEHTGTCFFPVIPKSWAGDTRSPPNVQVNMTFNTVLTSEWILIWGMLRLWRGSCSPPAGSGDLLVSPHEHFHSSCWDTCPPGSVLSLWAQCHLERCVYSPKKPRPLLTNPFWMGKPKPEPKCQRTSET